MKKKNMVLEWINSVIVAFLLVVIIRSFFFIPIVVDGESMNPTLQDKDRMVVTKIGELKRFDIVVFHAPDGKDYIKRVIGLPGDRIEYEDDVLYVNGKAYDEPYLKSDKERINSGFLTYSFTLKETAVGSESVPKDHLFVLGDNRRHSTDSRDIGAVPLEEVIGTTNIVYYPIDRIKMIKK